MSKKKVSGSTMTLKDFHGGSIPSDLPLPSAPGIAVRPSDRGGLDRPSAWGNPIGRSDQRLRPGSAGAARNLDGKTPFLSHNAHIGRNFDEDERKPLDGVLAPRRTVSDETIRAVPPICTEPKPEYSSGGRLPSRQVLTPGTQLPGGTASSYAARFVEATHVGVNSQSLGGNGSYSGRFAETSYVGQNSQNIGGISGQAVSGSYPNAWAARKEAAGSTEPVPGSGYGPNDTSKLAHASALEKVSSGRWQSRQPIYNQTDIGVVVHSETESEFNGKIGYLYDVNTSNMMDVASGSEYHVVERARSPLYSETKERNIPNHVDGVRSAFNEGKFGGLEPKSPVPSEPLERPKLKLLPRSKPLEDLELPTDDKLGYRPIDNGHVENFGELYANSPKHGVAGSESGSRAIERPKLNLKPKLQPGEQLEGNTDRGRKTLFGGARPRELVLKERGVDDDDVKNHDLGQPSARVKQDVPRVETVHTHASPIRYKEKTDITALDQRIGKNSDRRDHQVDVDRTDEQRRNRRNDNWRNSRETEKHQQQQSQERPPSPETWRKPVEDPKALDVSGVRYGKAASAVELAQVFSRSVSDQKTADRFPSPRGGLHGRAHVPFSRLTGPTPRPQINGY